MSSPYLTAESYHPANDHPKWSESYYFNFYDPQHKVGGLFRIGLLENKEESNVWVVLFKDGKLAYNRISLTAPYTPKRMDNGVEVAGLRMTSLEPVQKALVEFEDDDYSVNLTFEALAPIEDAIAMAQEDGEAMRKQMSSLHLEGPLRVTGNVVIRGTNIEVNSTGFRDIAWGTRNWDSLSHYRVSWPVFENGLYPALVHAVTTDGKSAYQKMFYDGSNWIKVKEIEDSVEFAEDGMTVKSTVWKFRDENNKEWEYRGKPVFGILIPMDGFCISVNIAEYRLGDTIGYGQLECGFRLPWSGINK